MNIRVLKSFVLLLFITTACEKKYESRNGTVEVKKVGDAFQLFRHGKPFYIKGAGGGMNLKKLKEYGGNSVRVWSSDNAQQVLDEAHQLGLTVTLGLDVGRERHGFDYDDKAKVDEQFERIRKEVLLYKDHPALLMWGVGNEVDQLGSNMKVWDAVNDIAEMIHEVDPNHPTSTMIVPYRKKVWMVKWKCPDIDILSINTFEELPDLSDKLRAWIWGWNGAYVVTEWGSTGWWETNRTTWDVPIEPSSTQKASMLRQNYKLIQNDKEKCLGSYVFFWGAKQERTPTWFSLFTESGHETEGVSIMQQNWTGVSQANKAPQISDIRLNDKSAKENIYLDTGKVYNAKVIASDPDKDDLFYYWEIMPEGTDLNGGGDAEKKLYSLWELMKDCRSKDVTFMAPKKEGPYRAYVYVYDLSNHVATVNIPFYVRY